MNSDSADNSFGRLREKQRAAWEAGQRLLVEQLVGSGELQSLPEDDLLELIVTEYNLRREFGELPTDAEFLDRFPSLSVRLQRLILLVNEMQSVMSSQTDGATGNNSIDQGKETSGAGVQEGAETSAQLQISRNSRALNRYTILRLHARGGIGEVFVAKDGELNREVALKEIQGRYAEDPENRLRFRQEAEITGNLEHPGIVPIYGLGQHSDGRPYYAMRFIRGDNLKEAITAFHERFPARQHEMTKGIAGLEIRNLLRRFVDVCNAIAYAHNRGVLHRDLKPGNIVLGKYGETLVVDWGLARTSRDSDAIDQTLPPVTLTAESGNSSTLPGSTIGTPAYMSPEQASGRTDLVGPATDIYSLGATLYHLLTNRPPVKGQTTAETLELVRAGQIANPCAVRSDVPQALAAVCLRAMAKQASDRYASPLELSEDVDRWLADEPVTCFRDSRVVRFQRWTRKHPAASSGIAVLLTSGIVALLIGLSLVNAEKNRTELARQGEAKQRIEAQTQRDRARRAEQLAKANEMAAKQSAAESESVLRFFETNVLEASRPQLQDGGLGLDVTLFEMISRAIPRITDAFKNQPRMESSIRNTLGGTYYSLGDYENAAKQWATAAEMREAAYGRNNPTTLVSLGNLAFAWLRIGGRQADAIKLLEEVARGHEHVLGPSNVSTLMSKNSLAQGLAETGQFERAIELFHTTLEGWKTLEGDVSANTLVTKSNLASALLLADRRTEAVQLNEETLEARRNYLGARHPDTLCSMNNTAYSYFQSGRLLEAIQLWEETLPLRREVLGENHPDTLRTMANLANGLASANELDRAIPMLEQTLALQTRVRGRDNVDTGRTLNNLANALSQSQNFDKALPLYRDALDRTMRELGPNHEETFVSLNNLAVCLINKGLNEEAIGLLGEAIPRMKQHLPKNHSVALQSCNTLAVLYLRSGQNDQALSLLQELHEATIQKFGDQAIELMPVAANLAEAYRKAGRMDEALKSISEASELANHSLSPSHPYRLSVKQGLILILEELKQFQLAEGHRKEIIQMYRDDSMTDSTTMQDALTLLGTNQINQNHISDAAAAFTEAIEIAGKVNGIDDIEVASVEVQWGEALLRIQSFNEAESHLRHGLAIRQKRQPDAWNTFNAQSLLGGCLTSLAEATKSGNPSAAEVKFKEAEALLIPAYEGLKNRLDQIPPEAGPRSEEALQRIIELYRVMQNKAEMDRWTTELSRTQNIHKQ